jgi:hypothetical protein
MPMPEATSVKVTGIPATSAINEPFFKNSRRELDIFYPPEPCLKIWAGGNGGAVYCFFEKLSTKKQGSSPQKRDICEIDAIIRGLTKHSCKVLRFDL